MRNSRVVAGFSIEDVEDAIPIAKALLAGGIDVIELTLRTDCALAAVKRIAEVVPNQSRCRYYSYSRTGSSGKRSWSPFWRITGMNPMLLEG